MVVLDIELLLSYSQFYKDWWFIFRDTKSL